MYPWENDGQMVDAEYFMLPSILDTKVYIGELLKLQPSKYAPFNVRKQGNTGYLFNCSLKMAAFLFDQLQKSSQNIPVLKAIQQ